MCIGPISFCILRSSGLAAEYRPSEATSYRAGGGSGCRNINLALSRSQPPDAHRTCLGWRQFASDQETLGILPGGDIRQALMTMAHGEKCAGNVIRMCNARLSEAADKRQLRTEFDFFADCRHSLLKTQPPSLSDAITRYLDVFRSHLPEDFDLGNGSIGNFILAGAYLAHDNDINAAISIFKGMCGIEGNVWPVAVASDVHLSARLSDGRVLDRRTIRRLLVRTAWDRRSVTNRIRRYRPKSRPTARDRRYPYSRYHSVRPGGHYSALPHLLVDGVSGNIRQLKSQKIFVGHADAPKPGMTLEAQLSVPDCQGPLTGIDAHPCSVQSQFLSLPQARQNSVTPVGSLHEMYWAQGISVVSRDQDLWQRHSRWQSRAHDLSKTSRPFLT